MKKKLFAYLITWFMSKPITGPQCGNYGNSLSRIFGKNFVKVTVLLSDLTKYLFSESKFPWFPQCAQFNVIICDVSYMILSKFPWNWLISNTRRNNNLFIEMGIFFLKWNYDCPWVDRAISILTWKIFLEQDRKNLKTKWRKCQIAAYKHPS